jgi:large subunit ribosomal protein L24
MKIKKGDNIVVIAGKDKGKTGSVLRAYPKLNKLVVENVSIKTKFAKKGNGQPGEQVKFEGKIDASNVMLLDPKTKKRTRVGYTQLDSNKKVRISKVSKEVIE